MDSGLQDRTGIDPPGIISSQKISKEIDPDSTAVTHRKWITKILHFSMKDPRTMNFNKVDRIVGIIRIFTFPGDTNIKKSDQLKISQQTGLHVFPKKILKRRTTKV